MILVIGGLASGKRSYAQSLGYRADEVVFDVHESVRAGGDLPALLQALEGKQVVTCAEVGSGIVPIDAGERAWREEVGELCQALAARAHTVVRMVCGIPVVLKEEPVEPCSAGHRTGAGPAVEGFSGNAGPVGDCATSVLEPASPPGVPAPGGSVSGAGAVDENGIRAREEKR